MDADLTCDVCIIGGNLAGSYLAYLLASEGVKVLIVEQNKHPGLPMQCAGIVSQRFTNIVEIDPSIIINRVDTAWLISENGKRVSVSIQDHPYIIDRVKLDQSFFQKALQSGAQFLLQEKFIDLDKTLDAVHIHTNKRKITAKILVGCDGPLSKVAKLHNIHHKWIPAKQIRVPYDHPYNSVEMYFKSCWKNLFGWVIPEGNGICRIGLGCHHNLKQTFDAFLDEIGVNREDIIEYLGGQIVLSYPRQIAFNRVILLGDAAGMVKATTGGGINTLLKASSHAKNAILRSLKTNDFSSKVFITHYQKSRGIRKSKRNIILHYLVRILLLFFTQVDYEESFNILNQPITRELLLRHGDMDFPAKLILKMALRTDLWVYIIKYILRIIKKIPDFLRELVKNCNL